MRACIVAWCHGSLTSSIVLFARYGQVWLVAARMPAGLPHGLLLLFLAARGFFPLLPARAALYTFCKYQGPAVRRRRAGCSAARRINHNAEARGGQGAKPIASAELTFL